MVQPSKARYLSKALHRRKRGGPRHQPSNRMLSSVEVGRQLRVFGVSKHQFDLLGRGASHRQDRQFAAREELDVAGFVAGPGASAHEFADEEQLVNRVEVARRVTL